MGISGKRFIVNALANVASGSASALMALVLPPILVRYLTTEVYGTWALVLQIGAYTGYLNFGIQTAIGRFVAHYTELSEDEQRNRIVSSAFAILTVAAVIGFIMVGILTWKMPSIFHKMPVNLVGDARIALLLVGCSLALGLPFNATNAIFVGLQRNKIPAKIAVVSKAVQGCLLILTVIQGGQLTALAVVFAVTNLVTYGWQWYVYKQEARFVIISIQRVAAASMRELIAYCTSLTVWSVAMLMITGLDTTIVGVFDFKAVAYYTVATSLITLILGFHNAVLSPLIPAGAALSASGTPQQVGSLLVKSTRICSLVLLLISVPMVIFAGKILTVWVGKDYALGGTLILQALVVGNIIRLIASPYAMLLIATGRQRAVLLTPLIEGVVNISSSILLAWLLGALGVAVGTVVGSIAGLTGQLLLNMSRTQDKIAFQFRTYYWQGILKPLLCFLPVTLYVGCEFFIGTGWQINILLFALISTLIVFAIMLYGLDAEERKTFLDKIRISSI
ncbi:polysaccharide biosynthesis protein [Geobacter sp. OR-1]|uniref:oligosaccharide flippase family protein n=1 Tax=Geobacter sp. OR-1 TaxID=1266765 RepID=UPI000543A27F|nr:oligosaccharide flippase family protein [Geobacter sp. OR-1]GAM08243.1 polysaccharide biosynthesis protein [Geobacter sp. OR-1]